MNVFLRTNICLLLGFFGVANLLSCQKDTAKPKDTTESKYYIKATINGIPTTYNAFATAYLDPALSDEVWYLRGFTGIPDTSAHNFTPDVQKSFSDYIYMEVGFSSGYPTVGLYPANGMGTQNWSYLQIYKYGNTILEPNFVTYSCVPFWDPTSSIINVELVNDSLIQGTFSGMVWLATDSTRHFKVENGSFYLHTSH